MMTGKHTRIINAWSIPSQNCNLIEKMEYDKKKITIVQVENKCHEKEINILHRT